MIFESFKPRQVSQRAFDELKELVLDTFSYSNYRLLYWINNGGPAIRGEQIFSTKIYIEFYVAYEAALEAARRNKYHSELSGLARALLAFETKPATPAEDLGSFTASGPGPQP